MNDRRILYACLLLLMLLGNSAGALIGSGFDSYGPNDPDYRDFHLNGSIDGQNVELQFDPNYIVYPGKEYGTDIDYIEVWFYAYDKNTLTSEYPNYLELGLLLPSCLPEESRFTQDSLSAYEGGSFLWLTEAVWDPLSNDYVYYDYMCTSVSSKGAEKYGSVFPENTWFELIPSVVSYSEEKGLSIRAHLEACLKQVDTYTSEVYDKSVLLKDIEFRFTLDGYRTDNWPGADPSSPSGTPVPSLPDAVPTPDPAYSFPFVQNPAPTNTAGFARI